MRQRFTPVLGARIERLGPGEEASNPEPGDFILTRGDKFFNKVIRFGQNIRFRGANRKYAYRDHMALVVNSDGNLIEATSTGVIRTNLTRYKDQEYHLVRLGKTAKLGDRDEMVAFAEWCLGEPYGWTTLVCIGVGLLTGGSFTFGFSGQKICSGLVAKALERTKAIFNRDSEDIMPADLAKYYQVDQAGSVQPASIATKARHADQAG
jgi:hypothetical protein